MTYQVLSDHRLQLSLEDRVVDFYYKGDSNLIGDYRRVAVVGSRHPTAYGRNVAEHIGKYLARRGIVVVSGLAMGIDSVAQKSACQVGGTSIGVIANGIESIYPARNRSLYEELYRKGLVISKKAGDSPPRKYEFVQRNEWIAALSEAVIFVEGAVDSGAMSTVRYALSQGKDIFAVPGSIYSHQSFGSNHLIFQGAHVLNNMTALDGPLGLSEPTCIIEERVCAPDCRMLLKDFVYHKYMSIGDIRSRYDWDDPQISRVIAELELEGFIYKIGREIYASFY